MTAIRGRAVSIVAASLCIIVLVASGFAFSGLICEQYYLIKLRSASISVRYSATISLFKLKSARAVPALVDLVKQASARDLRFMQLDNIGNENYIVTQCRAIGPAAFDGFISALEDEKEPCRYLAASCLGFLDNCPKRAVKKLSRCLADKSARVRKAAAFALAEMREEAAEAVPALKEALRDEDPLVRIESSVALGMILGPDVERVLER